MTWTVETRDLCRIYGNGDEVRALDNVNLKIAPGEFVAVMGPSGSGKSTLLNVLGALDKPTSGQILINGDDLAHVKDLDSFRGKTVGFIFQLHNLLPTLTSVENVEIPMLYYSTAKERRERALELLEMVGLAQRMNHLPGQLSGGQRQRVAIARALANRPSLVLADEPTGNLDSVNGRELIRLLRELNESQGTTFILVTHDHEVAAQTRRVVRMADGKITGDEKISSPVEQDLKDLRYSLIGQAIAEGNIQSLEKTGLDASEIKALQRILKR
ncbi:MAG: ABC transporter ATP-binding protein [Leptolinea sp.]|jgi:ABC-type lipoprotein export system ATPase subunit|nr:ABC transporter ATP-binding protein [Leptolinea sp.]